MTHALAFLLGGIFFGVGTVAILFNDNGEPTDAYQKVVGAIKKFRGIKKDLI